MKKYFIFCLAFLLLAPALFADDAKVMPAMVGRFYIAPSYSFAAGTYDNDGKYKSFGGGSVRLFNLGFALEFGILDWITAAVQWVPGWTLWSDIKPAVTLPSPATADINTNGVGDIFAGAKIQIIGENAPVRSQMFRFAVAPGVIIPLPGPDFVEEVSNVRAGRRATLGNMDRHVFGAGGRFYFDYVINENFFINLYNETIFYPFKQNLLRAGPEFAFSRAGLSAICASVEGEVNHRYRLTFEIEPVFSTFFTDGIEFTVGLPVNYRFSPAPDYSVTVRNHPLGAAGNAEAEKQILESLGANDTHLLSINPNVGVFLRNLPVPLEFKFQYNFPVYGVNEHARHTVSLQIRAYFAFR